MRAEKAIRQSVNVVNISVTIEGQESIFSKLLSAILAWLLNKS